MKTTILIVDDEPNVCYSLTNALKTEVMEIFHRPNGKTGTGVSGGTSARRRDRRHSPTRLVWTRSSGRIASSRSKDANHCHHGTWYDRHGDRSDEARRHRLPHETLRFNEPAGLGRSGHRSSTNCHGHQKRCRIHGYFQRRWSPDRPQCGHAGGLQGHRSSGKVESECAAARRKRLWKGTRGTAPSTNTV